MPEPTTSLDPEDVYRHARRVDALADQLAQADSAVRYVRLQAGAYGQLCAFLPRLLEPSQSEIEEAGQLAVTRLAAAAAALRSAAGYLEAANSTMDATIAATGAGYQQ